MSSNVPVFKVRIFASDFEFWIAVNEYYIVVVDTLTQILLTILLSIDQFSRSKLKFHIITHTKEKSSTTNWYFFAKLVGQCKSKEWAKFKFECLLLLICIYSNSKYKVTCKNVDFNCRYIGTHTKEKPSRISNIAILPFYQEKYSNWMAILSTLESIILLMKPLDALQNGPI